MSSHTLIKENEPLNKYCTYRTGGAARYFALPANIQELEKVLIWADALKLSHEVIGYGANLLISDKGYDGLIICLRNFEKWLIHKNNLLYAGAGVLLNEAVKYACDNGLAGLENLAGIPGTLGGAVRMNAGAFGTEMKDIVKRINILESELSETFTLNPRLITAEEGGFSYREAVGLYGKIVAAVELSLEPGNPEELNRRRREILNRRLAKQPLDCPSCGSVFKRPEGTYAGVLIEECGLKGVTVGGARVSEKHANFIISDGTATSADIYSLINLVKSTVLKNCGVLLEEEVKFLGDFSKN